MKLPSAPIPGMSWADEPKSKPWMRPPKISHPEAVWQFYNSKMKSDPKAVESVATMLSNGMTIKDVTEGILRLGVANGMHTIDAGYVVAPILHEKIKGIAKAFDIEVDDGFEDKAEIEASRKAEEKSLLDQAMARFKKKKKAAKKSPKAELMDPERQMTSEPAVEMPEDKPQGLMSRRNV